MFALGFSEILNVVTIGFIAFGVFIGIVFGAIPGLTGTMPEIPTDAEQRVILYGQQLQRFLSRGTITIACINTIWCKYVLDSQMDIFSYAPESNEAIDYDAFAKGFSQNIGENDLRSRNEYQPSVPEYMKCEPSEQKSGEPISRNTKSQERYHGA